MTDLVLHKIGSTFFVQNFLAHLYKNLAIEMFNEAKNTATPDHRRIGWLEDWSKKKGVLD